VAVDIEDRPEKGLPLVRLASAIQSEWLLDLHAERMREESRVEWNRAAERVDAVSVLLYDQIAIEETRGARPDPEAAAKLLAEKALEAGIGRFCDPKEVSGVLARVAFASEHSSVPRLSEADVRAALEAACAGLRSFAELKSADLPAALMSRLPHGSRRALDEVAPLTLRLPSGRNARVQYAAGQPPWVASRLQDFFGLIETPRVARGKVPLVVHLLAPNQRPVQTTTDLAGFWQRLYPQVRRELSRRYPKHAWPEKPTP
jgi:ATP-dependent RNA helicase HrpB